MRVLAAIAFVVPIVVTVYVLSRGPWPEPRAQAAARHAADSLTRAVPGDGAGGEVGTVTTGASRRGRLAWAAVDAGPQRRSVAYVLRDGRWTTLIESRALAPDWERLKADAMARRLAAPGASAAGATEGRNAQQLAKRFRRALAHFGRMRVDRQAVAVGPAADRPAAGDSAVRATITDWERRLGAPRLVDDGLVTWAPRRSGVGWVVADLEVSPPGWGGATLPLRLTAVYRARDEDNWGLVLVHLAAPAPAPGEPQAPAP